MHGASASTMGAKRTFVMAHNSTEVKSSVQTKRNINCLYHVLLKPGFEPESPEILATTDPIVY